MKAFLKKAPSFLLLFLLLFGIMLAQLILPGRLYSENENKYLATMPQLTLRTLLGGSFADKYDTYVSDQLPARDSWIGAKSFFEALLLKTENNGVVYGEDGYLFAKFQSYDEDTLQYNLQAISAFCSKANADVTLLPVPSSYAVLADKLPADVPFVDQQAGFAAVLSQLGGSCSTVNTLDVLSAHAQDYIYYRTDHHWTTLGAWYAYEALCGKLGLTPLPYDADAAHTSENFLGTSYSKCKKAGVIPDTLHYFDNNSIITVGEARYGSIYDFTKLAGRDKYSMFLHGNAAESFIECAGSGEGGHLLIIKDSYADSLIPFLTAHYETITCIDPRYYPGSFSELAAGEYTDIVLLFGFENLAGEIAIAKLGL